MRRKFNLEGINSIEDISEIKSNYTIRAFGDRIYLIDHNFLLVRFNMMKLKHDDYFTYIDDDKPSLLHDMFLPIGIDSKINTDFYLVEIE